MFNSFQGGSCITTSLTNGGKTKDRVIINVGGTRHECYISTIQNFPDTRLYWIAETALKMADFDPEGNEFFFDRHPQCFTNILNYCRTGKLHCPNDVCGPLFEQELAFWGVDELMMEPCCWGTYTQHRDAHKNLSMFDEMHLNSQEGAGEEFDDDEFNEEDLALALTKKRCRGTSHKNLWNKIAAFRPTLWSILEKPFSSVYAQVSAFVSLVIILMSLTTFCAETVKYFKEEKKVFEKLEYFYCGFFTFELLLRLWCCPSKKKYFKSMMTWIDIISTAQFYISFATDKSTFDFLFVTRLLRVFRLFRFFKNLSGMQVIAQTLKASANELLLLCIIVFIPMVIFSTMVFYAEFGQPSNPFSSIPGTFWWTIITMTTVGYGDVTPKSLPGKIIGAFTACSGVLIVALPVSVIGSNFSLYYSYAQARMRLPKRKSPALVSADKALIPNAASNKPAADQEAIGFSLKNFANVVIDIAGVNRSSPVKETDSPPPCALRRERSRRDAIQPSNNPINSPKTIEKTKPNRKKKVSKVTSAEKIAEEPSVTSEESDTSKSDIHRNHQKICLRRSLPAIEHGDTDENGKSDETLLNANSCHVNGSRKTTRSMSETKPPSHFAISPSSNRRRHVIHCDNELLRYRPKKLSVVEQKMRRKLTSVPNFHSTPFELNAISESNNKQEDVAFPPWMRAAALGRSPPALQETVLIER